MSRIIRGSNEGYELLTSVRIGPLSASTTSTSFVQPYTNEQRTMYPNVVGTYEFGYENTYVSLTGRLHNYTSSSEAHIAAYVSGTGVISETEYVSATGASFEDFHTPRGVFPTADKVEELGFHLKSSNGDEVEAHGYVLAHIWGKLL